jgi:hypothetical protein
MNPVSLLLAALLGANPAPVLLPEAPGLAFTPPEYQTAAGAPAVWADTHEAGPDQSFLLVGEGLDPERRVDGVGSPSGSGRRTGNQTKVADGRQRGADRDLARADLRGPDFGLGQEPGRVFRTGRSECAAALVVPSGHRLAGQRRPPLRPQLGPDGRTEPGVRLSGTGGQIGPMAASGPGRQVPTAGPPARTARAGRVPTVVPRRQRWKSTVGADRWRCAWQPPPEDAEPTVVSFSEGDLQETVDQVAAAGGGTVQVAAANTCWPARLSFQQAST